MSLKGSLLACHLRSLAPICATLLRLWLADCAADGTIDPATIEPIISSRLIPLDIGKGIVRVVEVGEVIRGIIGKCVAKLTKQVILDPSCSLQVYAGHKSGSEAAVHAEDSLFQHVETDAVRAGGCVKRFQHIKPSRLPLNHQRSMSCYNCDQYLPSNSTTVCRGGGGGSKEFISVGVLYKAIGKVRVCPQPTANYLSFTGSDSSQTILVCS